MSSSDDKIKGLLAQVDLKSLIIGFITGALILGVISLIISSDKPSLIGEAIIVGAVGFTYWGIRRYINQKMELQSELIRKSTQARYDFKQFATQEAFEQTIELYRQANLIRRDFYLLYPRPDVEKDKQEEYRRKVNHFFDSILGNQILLHEDITKYFLGLYQGIKQYENGKWMREQGKEAEDLEMTREGGKEMSQGAKAVPSNWIQLTESIRVKFGLDKLPNDIVKPPIDEMEKALPEDTKEDK